MVVLPTPPFGAKTDRIRVEPVGDAAANSFRTCGDAVHQVEAGERHREDAVDARVDVDVDRVLRDRQDDHRDAEAGLAELLDELGALDPALEQVVDEDDVGPQLADLGQRLAAVADDVEQLHRLLRVEQPADVLRDLGDVLDDQEACLIAATGSA